MKELKVNPLKQSGLKNCWAACLSMALEIKGYAWSESQLVNKFNEKQGLDLFSMNSNWPKGSPFSNIKPLYLSDVVGKKPVLDFQEIVQFIDDKHPIIIGVQDYSPGTNYSTLKAHALLITGYSQDKQVVVINDPYLGAAIELTYSQLTQLTWVETIIL